MPSKDLPVICGGTPLSTESPPEWPGEWPEITEALRECLADRSWGKYHGPNCKAFSDQLSEFFGGTEIVLCASGTAAVELALRGIRVEPGDEVILSAYDFKANFQNVLTIGAVPVLVDVDPVTWQLDVSKIESAVSNRTKAIIVSHLHGAWAPMRPIMELASRHDILVVEDACQATGAVLNGHRAGTSGHAGVLSFGGSKLMTSGRGGAVITSRPEIAQRIRLFTQRGNEAYPLSELQAAVLRPQLKQLDERNRIRWESVQTLSRDLKQVTSSGHEVLRPLVDGCEAESTSCPAFFKVGLQFDPDDLSELNRNEFSIAMKSEGIALEPGFRGLHRIHSRRRFRTGGPLPNADFCDEHVLVLHHPVLLEGEAAIRRISQSAQRVLDHADAVKSALSGRCR